MRTIDSAFDRPKPVRFLAERLRCIMKQRSLLVQLYPSYLLIIVISVFVVAVYALHYTANLHRSELERDLASQAVLFAHAVEGTRDAPRSEDEIRQLCEELGKTLPVRLTVMLANGSVIGDSDADPASMENHLGRPEMQAAIQGEARPLQRYSSTVDAHMLYAVAPVFDNTQQPAAYVRVAIPLTTIEETIRAMILRISIAAVLVALLAAIVALQIARRLTKPLLTMRQGALRFAEGDFSCPVPSSGSEEMAALAASLNNMAQQLDQRINQLFQEKNTREAVFYSMAEGLLAIDTAERVIHINRAAASLLGIEAKHVTGQSIQAAVRNTEMQKLLREAMDGDQRVEAEITLNGKGDLRLVVRATALHNTEGKRFGALLVMQDVTHVRQLEQIRQDFVANVSHELKTPITSIKGFVETLLDGAADHPETRERFLQVIARQTDHLDAIISDLLLLSSVEYLQNQKQIPLEVTPIRPLLESAVANCQLRAGDKQMRISLQCDPSLSARVSPHLLEQAVTNLVDNAIKYSPANESIEVGAHREQQALCIYVRDHGPGIESIHRARLFERFYRIDKGRSREMGGTGLGLAITKHIANAHGGRISVDSTVGAGSTFQLHLPEAAQQHKINQ